MNKSLLLLCALITFTLISCKKDDPAPKTTSILGTWYASETLRIQCTESTNDGSVSYNCPSGDCLSLIFVVDTVVIDEEKVANQVYSMSSSINGTTMNESGTFELGSGSITLCIDEEGEITCRNMDLDLSGDDMTLKTTNSQTGCRETTTYTRASAE